MSATVEDQLPQVGDALDGPGGLLGDGCIERRLGRRLLLQARVGGAARGAQARREPGDVEHALADRTPLDGEAQVLIPRCIALSSGLPPMFQLRLRPSLGEDGPVRSRGRF